MNRGQARFEQREHDVTERFQNIRLAAVMGVPVGVRPLAWARHRPGAPRLTPYWVRGFCETDNVGSKLAYGVPIVQNRNVAERTRFTPPTVGRETRAAFRLEYDYKIAGAPLISNISILYHTSEIYPV